MRKAQRERLEADNARQLATEIRAGRVYGVFWTLFGRFGPLTYATLDEAAAKRDEMLVKNEVPTPKDHLDRDDMRLNVLDVWIEKYDRGTWHVIEGSKRSVVAGVTISAPPKRKR